MKQLFSVCFFVCIISCQKTEDLGSPQPEYSVSNVTNKDLIRDQGSAFRAVEIRYEMYSRWPSTSEWKLNHDQNDISKNKDRRILFKSDSTYECDQDLAFAFFISQQGKYIQNNAGDSIQFVSRYRENKLAIRKLYDPEAADKYLIELNIQDSNSYSKYFAHARLEQVN